MDDNQATHQTSKATTMSFAQEIYQKSLSLPPEKAREVIDFIDFIKDRPSTMASDGARETPEPPLLLTAFEQAGLVGCLETDEQLSTNYKAQLDFSRKHAGDS